MFFKLGELFCGPGGIGYAAITAKISDPNYKILHVWANNKYIYTIFIDVLAFGFPCNDFCVVDK